MSASPGGSENLQTNLESKQTQIDSLKTQTQNNTTSIAANVSAINTQKTRIDNLAHLEEGSTTGDAELIDGRTNENEDTFTNIGSNIRDTQKILNYILTNTLEITPETHQYVNYVTGNIYTHTQEIYATNFIPCIPGGKIIGIKTFSKKSDARGYAFYNKNKQFVSGASYNNDLFNDRYVSIDVPDTARYFRASINTSSQRNNGRLIIVPNLEKIVTNDELIAIVNTMLSENDVLSLIENNHCIKFKQPKSDEMEILDWDFDNFPRNSVYYITQGQQKMIELDREFKHTPLGTTNDWNGTVITLDQPTTSAYMTIQIALRGSSSNKNFYFRKRWATPSGYDPLTYTWVKIISQPDIDAINSTLTNLQNQINNINEKFPELYTTFRHVGCIGDSLASGEVASHQEPDAQGKTYKFHDLYDFSWGQCMARMSDNTYYNFSSGGQTTRSWLTAAKGAQLAFDGQHACEAYIIGLGVNDKGYLGNDYLGTIDDIDISDYHNNEDTYYGNYGKIIQMAKELYPKAKFFLITNPKNGYTDWNQAVRNIANLFDNCYVIDLFANHFNDYNDANGLIEKCKRQGHYNAIAYQYMAEIIKNDINKIMYNNPNEFQQIEFINTNWDW